MLHFGKFRTPRVQLAASINEAGVLGAAVAVFSRLRDVVQNSSPVKPDEAQRIGPTIADGVATVRWERTIPRDLNRDVARSECRLRYISQMD